MEYRHFSKEPPLPSYTCDLRTSEAAGNVDFHIHDFYEIFMLLHGEIQYFVENICRVMGPGDVILFSDKEIHKAINPSGKPFTRLVLHIGPALLKEYSTAQTDLLDCFHRAPGTDNLVTLTGDERMDLLAKAQLLRQCADAPGEYGNDVAATTALVQILLLINKAWKRTASRKAVYQPHRVQAIMEYIESHLVQALTLDDIAKAFSVNKYHLSHLFKAETGSTVFQYVLVKRVALAKRHLLEGHTVEEACHLSGFQDYANFIRSFRKIAGLTPGKYQKRSRD